jgi:hypothetical protein
MLRRWDWRAGDVIEQSRAPCRANRDFLPELATDLAEPARLARLARLFRFRHR